ncbi:MAG: ABC transporter ATP-binding protein [Oscillibacter sp.]|nr:ABC transporter ATP-binding protein [Oscillibacter sp.]
MRDCVHVEHIWKSYGERTVLRDVRFTAGADRVTCVMAPSGAGKTTLLRILLGLEPPDRGTVSLPGTGRWAAVFQEDRLLEHLDVWGNLRFALGADWDASRAAALLEELGLAETAGEPVRAFSGGMRRRLALIRALLAPFDALALDEPFTGLDGENRERCRACLLREAAGHPVVLVTHEEADAAGLRGEILRL